MQGLPIYEAIEYNVGIFGSCSPFPVSHSHSVQQCVPEEPHENVAPSQFTATSLFPEHGRTSLRILTSHCAPAHVFRLRQCLRALRFQSRIPKARQELQDVKRGPLMQEQKFSADTRPTVHAIPPKGDAASARYRAARWFGRKSSGRMAGLHINIVEARWARPTH